MAVRLEVLEVPPPLPPGVIRLVALGGGARDLAEAQDQGGAQVLAGAQDQGGAQVQVGAQGQRPWRGFSAVQTE